MAHLASEVMNDSKIETERAINQAGDLDQTQRLLRQRELTLFYLQAKLKLMQIQDTKAELPLFLQWLKQHFPVPDLPEYCLVMCYPFTQECFIFHALAQPLAQSEVRLLQEQLLPRSVAVMQQDVPLLLGQHDCLSLFTGQNFAVWRVYLNYSAAQPVDVELLQQLDQALQSGFQERALQQERIQTILQQERRDFSADLHDSIAQIIGFLRLKSAQLNQQCKQQPGYAPLLEQTEELAAYTHYAYQQVRELITASRLTYQELDFFTALKKIIAEFEHQSSVAFELDNRVPQLKVSARQSVQLLYIIRESLSNVVRHAHASTAVISVKRNFTQQLHIQIADNGRGIQAGRKRPDSFGLEIMQERAERIGAVLSIRPNQPCGTCVELILDLSTGGK